jgi:hypothetical protein
MADSDYEATFRGAITGAIPSFIQILEHEEGFEDVWHKAVEVMGDLANHGELQLTALRHN